MKRTATLTIACTVAMFSIGCNSTTSHRTVSHGAYDSSNERNVEYVAFNRNASGPFTYWYWSNEGVFFDPDRDLFFTQVRGSTKASEVLPSGGLDQLGTAQVIRLNQADPFATRAIAFVDN